MKEEKDFQVEILNLFLEALALELSQLAYSSLGAFHYDDDNIHSLNFMSNYCEQHLMARFLNSIKRISS